MSNPEVLKKFWYDFTDDQRNVILNNCHKEYDKFLQGKKFDAKSVRKHVKLDEVDFIRQAQNGNLKIIKTYVQLGLNIGIGNDWAFQVAAENGHLEIVKYLVEHGANVHAENDYALKYSASNGHLSVVKYLVEHGADIHAGNNSALVWASNFGHAEVVEYLQSLS